jgi:hypothetical protein
MYSRKAARLFISRAALLLSEVKMAMRSHFIYNSGGFCPHF